MKTQNNIPSETAKGGERRLLWDGSVLYEKYKDWLAQLKEATAVLASAQDDINEFAPELTLPELIKMQNDFTVYMEKLERKALDWVKGQRPLQQEYAAGQADKLLTVLRQAFSEWQKIYLATPIFEGRHISGQHRDLKNLAGLFEGFTDAYFESIRDDFNEYAETPAEIGLMDAMQRLADAANAMVPYARHWMQKMNPLGTFCKYDEATQAFVPSIEGIKAYASPYVDAPAPEPTEEQQAEAATQQAREMLRQIIYEKIGRVIESDAELLGVQITDTDARSLLAKKHQETLRKQLTS